MNEPPRDAGPLDFARSRFVAVLNRASGGFDGRCEALVRTLLDDAGIPHARVVCAGPSDLRETLRRAIGEAAVVVLLAGDGTIAEAANLCGGQGPLLVPLPGGTMNVLSRALYGRRPWPQVLRKVLSDPCQRIVSGGRAGERLFLVSALFGVPPVWVQAREALRQGDLAAAAGLLAEELRHPPRDDLRYDFGHSVQGSARAVAVRCPLTSGAIGAGAAMLEAAAIDPRSAAQALDLGVNALFGRWRDNGSVTVKAATTVRISGPASVPAVLDGEAMAFPDDVQISFAPRAMKVLTSRSFLSGGGATRTGDEDGDAGL